MRPIALTLASGTLAFLATSASAGHGVVAQPVSRSSVIMSALLGPSTTNSYIQVTNGTIDFAAAGPGGSFAHDPLSPTQSGVIATIAGGPTVHGGSAAAGSNLATGKLKAGIGAYGPNLAGNPGGVADALLADTIWFTNSTGGDVEVTLRYSFDGAIVDTNGNAAPEGLATLAFYCDGFYCYNNALVPIRSAGTGSAIFGDITARFYEGGIYSFSSNIGAGTLFDRFDVWQSAPYGAGNLTDGWMQARLLIPTGMTSLGLSARLYLYCTGGSQCDFGHTGTFGFVDPLPNGLSFSSASGVFLTEIGNGGGGGVIPEPGIWAMLIAGFGLVGASARRRRLAMD